MTAVPMVGLDLAGIYTEHRLALVRLAVLLVDDLPTAEDVVHDSFMNLHRNREKLRDQEAALTLLRTSVVNGARAVQKRRGHQPAGSFETSLPPRHRDILEAVRSLPDRQQEVIKLHYFTDFGEAEIANVLGMSRANVKTHLVRAVTKVNEIIRGAR